MEQVGGKMRRIKGAGCFGESGDKHSAKSDEVFITRRASNAVRGRQVKPDYDYYVS